MIYNSQSTASRESWHLALSDMTVGSGRCEMLAEPMIVVILILRTIMPISQASTPSSRKSWCLTICGLKINILVRAMYKFVVLLFL